jgi:predicted ATPase/class 3 adenylate cyclase
VGQLPTGTVTFLFTDLEGSTRLWEEHPEAMKPALARHDEILREAIAAHDGHIVKTRGDGVHAVFADAHAAVEAAAGAQLALKAEPWTDTGALRVRMGIHSGPAEQRAGDYYGTALNRAARLMSVAHGGQVVVSLATEELLRDAAVDVDFVDLGEHRLPDLSQPERVFQLRAAGLDTEFPPLRSLDAFRANLPAQATSFIGRESEIAALRHALDSSRLVTITGTGGVGKTRLAIHLAADLLPDMPDGAWLCELAGATDGDSLQQIVAAALGVSPRADVDLGDAIGEFLRPRELVLVLDNCEHLVDAAAALAGTVMRRCPRVRILATSREGLGIAGEQVWPLRSLSVDGAGDASGDAVQLFAERARAVRPSFTLDDANASAVTELCRRLDGMPLPIELAAARVVSMTPREIVAKLDERFRLLTGGRRSAVERQQTLRATVDWSYSLLDERDRLVFDRLGVFVGGFDADAATAVASRDGIEEWDVLDALADLAGKSLVVSEDTPAGTTRYDMLETLRHYARERLDESGDADNARRRHADHYARFAEEAAEALRGSHELEWRARLRTELDNLRSAVSWSLDSLEREDGEFALRIIAGLGMQQGYDPALGIGEWATRAIDRAESSTPGRRHTVLAAAAYHFAVHGDYERAEILATEALRDGIPDDAPWPIVAVTALDFVEMNTGRPEATLERTEALLNRYGDRLPAVDAVTMHAHAAGAAAWTGDAARARAHAERGLERGRSSGSPSGLASALFGYANAIQGEDRKAARDALEESIHWIEAGGSPVVYGYALATVAALRAEAGETIGALRAAREAIRYASDTGNASLQDGACIGAMILLVQIGEPELGLSTLPPTWRRLQSSAFGFIASYEDMLAEARRTLGDSAFERFIADAEAREPDQGAQHAIEVLDRLIAERGDD